MSQGTPVGSNDGRKRRWIPKAFRRWTKVKLDTSQIAQAMGRKHNLPTLKKIFSLVGNETIWSKEISPKMMLQTLWICAPGYMFRVAAETLAAVDQNETDDLLSKTSDDILLSKRPFIRFHEIPQQYLRGDPDELYREDLCEAGIRIWRNLGLYKDAIRERRRPRLDEYDQYFMQYRRCKKPRKGDGEYCGVHNRMLSHGWKAEVEYMTRHYDILVNRYREKHGEIKV